MTINDFQQRTFTFTSVSQVTCGSLPLAPPATGCKCGKLLDMVISLDRSGSVQVSQWKSELAFTKNLTQAFDYGPDKANVGIVNWNANQWNTIPITSGTSATVVNGAVNAMTCCGTPPASNPTSACCCCGTPIGGGLWAAGNMMATSTRTKATKVICLLTDGCQNHIWDPSISDPTKRAISCGCTSEKACETNTNCTGDITKWYNWVQDNIPGTKVIVIGVGTASTICPSQLLLAAGNDPTRVYQPQSWADLITIVQSISATACTTDNVPCPGCCGICTCGVCFAPSNCTDQDKCNKGYIAPGSTCCGVDPVICTPDPCHSVYCDPNIGCVQKPITCKPYDATAQPPELCREFYCDNTTITCKPRARLPVPSACVNQNVSECINSTECVDLTNCTTDACVNGKCVHTQITCPLSTQCSITSCRPFEGCYTYNTSSKCNDNNACTDDSCDPVNGCINKNITCPTPKDPCKWTTCDKISGCLINSVDCSNVTKDENVTCIVGQCNSTCYKANYCIPPEPQGEENAPPTTVILASTLGTAAIAGIVCGAVILAAGVGGGAAAAVAGGAGAGGATAVFNNPTFVSQGMEGNNPIAQN
jgi:hypothetical protein